MQRRDFCKLMAAAAASTALPLHAQTSDQPLADLPAGFDKLTEDFAQFCARRPEERVFYALVNGRIVEQKLDESTWHPTGLC